VRLPVNPLLESVPRPPCEKGDPAYRAWYVARKQGWVSLYEAVRIFDRAGKSLTDSYPHLAGNYDDYEDDDFTRKCRKCDGIFRAHTAGQPGAPRTICDPCRNPSLNPRTCSLCNRVFTPKTKSYIYCSAECRKRVARERQKQKQREVNKEKRPRPCADCSKTFMVRRSSTAKYCAECRLNRKYEANSYQSDWPMCAACGDKKTSRRWSSCGKPVCRERLQSAKKPAKIYRISAEEVLILRSCPRCDSCKMPFKTELEASIDHCHKTWRIRGVLCRACNSALGFMKEDEHRIRLLADYAERYT